MTRHLLALVFLLSASIARGADPSPLATTPIQQETLTNGLRVIYVPIRQSPVVHVRLLYHVGSRDEKPDRQGFAHLFEHMMFRGSAHVGEQDFPRLIRAAGGVFNGQTDQDITTYFDTLPKNQLALALYLEADRMAGFRVTPEIFRVERDVVLEEISLKSEDPFIPASENLLAEMFRSNSYRWTALGNPRHLMSADVAELRQFFDRFYVPNNAVLVIAGDFESEAAKHLVHQYFEWIPRGAQIVRSIIPQPPQTAPRRIEINRPVNNVMLMAGCQVPSYGSDDDAALIVLEQAIKLRVLPFLTLEDNHLASATFTQLSRFEDDGCLAFGATLLGDADAGRAERILNIRLQLLREEGILASEAQFKSLTDAICNELLRQRQTYEGLSDQIGRGVVFRNQPDVTEKLIAHLRSLTAPMVRDAAQKYLKPEALTFMIIRPQRVPTTQVTPGNPAVVTTQPSEPDRPPVTFPADYPTRIPFEAPLLVAPVNSIVEIRRQGLTALLLPEPRVPGVELRFLFPRGWQNDPAGKEGLGRLTASLLADRMGKPSFPVMWLQQRDATTITLVIPGNAYQSTVDDLADALRTPLLPAVDDRLFPLKWQLFNDAKSHNDQAVEVAGEETRAALFGDSAPGKAMTTASLREISRQDVDVYRRRLFNPDGAIVTLYGNITAQHAGALLDKLFDGWTADAPLTMPAEAIESALAARHTRPRIILVDSPGSHESFIHIGSSSIGRDSREEPAAALAGPILSQRMFQTMRSDKGYTYMMDADFHQTRGLGLFTAQTATSVARTGTTVAALLSNIKQLAGDGPTESELADAKSGLVGSAVMQLSAPLQQMNWRAMALVHGYEDDLTRHLERITAVTPTDIRQLFAVYAHPGQIVVVVVAPAAQVKADLDPLGDVEVRPMPNRRPGAATRPAFEEIPKPMM